MEMDETKATATPTDETPPAPKKRSHILELLVSSLAVAVAAGGLGYQLGASRDPSAALSDAVENGAIVQMNLNPNLKLQFNRDSVMAASRIPGVGIISCEILNNGHAASHDCLLIPEKLTAPQQKQKPFNRPAPAPAPGGKQTFL